MKLSLFEVKKIIAKVYDDLNLYHSDKYPIQAHFSSKNNEIDDLEIAHWTGGYDYSNPEAVGDKINFGEYLEYYLIVDDEKGEAVMYGYYTGHYYIALKNGKYEILGKTTEMKRPW